MSRFLIACLLAWVVALTNPSEARAQATKPNILVIFGDDIGWMNVSSYGGDIMGVPNTLHTAPTLSTRYQPNPRRLPVFMPPL